MQIIKRKDDGYEAKNIIDKLEEKAGEALKSKKNIA